jgi:hypothetical protein
MCSAGTGMGTNLPPLCFTVTGTGEVLSRGGGDRDAFPDGEFPVAISIADQWDELISLALQFSK